ncbi:TCF3 fusion partner homolog [Argiope bruennichi]|uniref:TCF3 fusion partner like protein n=1 Tax=Argiope bruennichi TaxID=94029 RepID=A0A8T0FMY4_ARGBR|nr:TCF3 fusion partner homolog [Argiope bruennichi]KAF8792421.1 TCF3 fusion partner like protein [Argiope bruennichi]
MQAKIVREKTSEFLHSNAIKIEIPEKGDKTVMHTDIRLETSNGEVKSESKEEFLPYERKYFALLHRCELVKQSNERLVNRIYYVKKLLRRRKKERKFLMDRLDSYGDDYMSVAQSLFSEMVGDSSPTRTPQQSIKSENPSSSFLVQVKSELDS